MGEVKKLINEGNYSYDQFMSVVANIQTAEVDKESTSIADKKKWDPSDLAFMKNQKLRDLSYKEQSERILEVKGKDGESVLFSNRDPGCGEPRGYVLINALNELKAQNPEMSLYAALNLILQDPARSPYLAYNVSLMSMLIEEIGNNKPLKNEIHSALVFLFKCYFAARDAAEKIGRKELKSWNEQMKIHWGEIVEFLNFPKPKDIQYAFASFILEQRDMPGSAKYALAKLALEQTLESLNERNLSKEAGNNLLREVDRLKAQYPRDTAIFAEVLWKTKCITAEPDNKQYENDYTALAQKVAKRRWGKIIIGAMLGVAFAAAFTLACISTCGVSLGLGLVALSLNYLIPTAAASAMTSIVGFSLFVKGLEKNKKLQHLSQTMAETMKMKGKKDGEEKIPHHHKR